MRPLDTLTNMLAFIESTFGEDHTRLVFNFSNTNRSDSIWKSIFLRDIEGKPLKLKEWFDKKYNREFW